MTEIGYKELIDMILIRRIELPESGTMTMRDMEQWLSGYANCQHEILNIINRLAEGQMD